MSDLASSNSASMTPHPDSESRESSPARRPNARTSCDLCKRMKIKCERQGSTCLHCIDRGAQCETTLVERKKRQLKRIDPGSIVQMENRIKRLEAVIASSALDSRLNADSPGRATDDTPPHDSENLTDRLSTLMIDEEGSSNFLGSASGLSMFSPQGLQWISERTGNIELPKLIKRIGKERQTNKAKTQLDLWYPLHESAREPLPPKHVADLWVRIYFETFNTMFPLYDWEVFEQYYTRHYSSNPPPGAAWFASINVVLGIGSLVSEVHSQIDGRGQAKASSFQTKVTGLESSSYEKYVRNATSCFTELVFDQPSLMAVQALCGMAFLQQMTLEPHSFNVVTASAGRMAYSIGLHRKLDDPHLSEADINQRKNVFWIVYILDKTLALRLGHPSVMSDDDIGVDLPKEHKKFSYYPDGSRMYDIFRCQVQLAKLQSRIYSELYSARAHKRPALDRLRSVGQLDKELQDWRMSVPVEIRPDEFIRCSPEQFPPVFLVHFEFFNCVSTIHRVSVHYRGPWMNEDAAKAASSLHNPQLNPRVYSSQAICLSAARSTIKLLQYIDVIDIFSIDKFVWTEMYYPLSAFLLVFSNLIHNPEDPSAVSDLQLMDVVVSTLSPMMSRIGPYNATAALKLFEKLRNVAKEFVENRLHQHGKKTKRTLDSDVPKDDRQPVAVVPDPGISVPNARAREGPSNMPYVAQPFQANMQQCDPQSEDEFEDGSFISDAQSMMPIDDMGFPTMGFDAFTFSENFEWDLANLWNQEYSPASHVE